MKKRTKILRLLLIVILALALAACGDTSGGGSSGSSGGGSKGENTVAGGIISVTHPSFKLTDGFIQPVEQVDEAPEGYIVISTADDFNKIRNNSSANYILMSDIDLSDFFWKPIETFSGILDGNGYKVLGIEKELIHEVENGAIINLGVNGDVTGCAGIAYEMEQSTLNNCYFEGSLSGSFGGGLVASAWDCTINNCYNAADVNMTDGSAAGIASYISGDYSVITNCFNTGDVTGKDFSAGILGHCSRVIENITIRNCYNKGTIECIAEDVYLIVPEYGEAIACGIAGEVIVTDDGFANISYCYNSGTIIGGDIAFGICTGGDSVNVWNCYNYGEFTHSNSYGIAGYITGGGYVSDMQISYCYNVTDTGAAAISNICTNLYCCYYLDSVDKAIAKDALFSDVYALSADDMKKEDSFYLDFESIWQMGEGDYKYPVFKFEDLTYIEAVG